MKQKDKKRLKRDSGRLTNIDLPDNESLDDIQGTPEYKAKRTSTKSQISLKNNLELKVGRILEIKSNYQNVVDIDGKSYICSLSGRVKQYQFNTNILTSVGDYAEVDMSHAPVYRIENILPRKNSLSRFNEGKFQREIVVASNIDQVIITASWKMPDLKPGLLDRYICLSSIYGIDPVICITKMDLCDYPEDIEHYLGYYQKLGIPLVLTSVKTGEGMEQLKAILKDKESVFSGQSGTGKTSIVNYYEPGLKLSTGEVSHFNEKGRHTTTQAILIPWSFGGYLVDTPGIKTINLHSEHKELIRSVFPGFGELSLGCYYRSCTHTHEEDCAVKKAVESDFVPIERYDSYLRILESI